MFMLGSAFLFLDWRFARIPSILKSPPESNEMKTSLPQDSLIQCLKKPSFLRVTLFVSCLFLTVLFLPVIWFQWLQHSLKDDLELGK